MKKLLFIMLLLPVIIFAQDYAEASRLDTLYFSWEPPNSTENVTYYTFTFVDSVTNAIGKKVIYSWDYSYYGSNKWAYKYIINLPVGSYYVYLSASNTAGTSSTSNSINIKVKETIPYAPRLFKAITLKRQQ
jgi:PKD repeat protein